jgi:signal transduction histidine kinase
MKFKSIFHRLLVYYISVSLFGLGLLGLVINLSLQELLFEKKESVLYDQADQLILLLKQTKDLNEDPLFKATISFNKRVNHTKMDLWLIDETDSSRKINKQKFKLLKKSDITDPQILERVLDGERIRHVGTFKHASNEVLLTVGVPVIVNDKIVGVLFLHTPVQEIPTGEVSKLIIMISLCIGIPSTIVLYWISRRISVPLVKINDATRLIGEGHFKERMKVESEDEVGQLAITFNQMAEQLDKLESMRKELIMNVSHEIRTPLTSIRGFIQGMMEGVIPTHQRDRYLEICYREIHRLSSLLNTMLELSAIESGRTLLQPVLIRWDSLLDSIANSVRVRMEEKKITFYIEQDDHELYNVYGDPERLKQVLFNILDNAIRYTPENGIISIITKKTNHEIEVKISDTGMGIEPQKLSHIWERFYTDDPSRTSHRERSGLGLTITKQLVEMMGGRISVDSKVGIGTTFILYLPISPTVK